MNLETKITIYKFTPQVFTLTLDSGVNRDCQFSQRNLFSESIEQKYLLTCIKQNRHLNIKGYSF